MNRLLTLAFVLCTSFLMAEDQPIPGREQGLWQTLIMITIALLFFYVILWRPEQKRRKALDEQRSKLRKGDRVTAMGIIGTVSQIKDHSVVLRMIDGNQIEFLTAAITDVQSPAAPEKTDE